MALLPPSSVPNGNVPPGVSPFNVRISSLCSLEERETETFEHDIYDSPSKSLTLTLRNIEPSCQQLVLYYVSLLCEQLMRLERERSVSFPEEFSYHHLPSFITSARERGKRTKHVDEYTNAKDSLQGESARVRTIVRRCSVVLQFFIRTNIENVGEHLRH